MSSRFFSIFVRCSAVVVVCLGVFATLGTSAMADEAAARWYKGNTHAHTVWSDGDELPEMAALWYRDHGYDFLAISDHNCLMEGDVWKSVGEKKHCIPAVAVENCQKQFGKDWVVMRQQGQQRQVKLKTFDEICAKLAEPGKFLLVPNEEISTGFEHRAIHLNAFNLVERIAPKVGTSCADTISLNVAAGVEQALRLNRPMFVHVNHPNFAGFSISAEDLAASSATIFEVCNGHPGVCNGGDAAHPSVEKIWDIANTIRIAKMKTAPLLAVASDDTHNYRQSGPGAASPGRGWIMVHASELSPAALVEAVRHGDFYASTGVTLRNVAYDAKQRVVSVEVEPKPGASYTIEFIGTLQGVDPTGKPVEVASGKKPKRPGSQYSPEIGKVLASVKGASARYKLNGKELYVRAVVRSNQPVANPSSSTWEFQKAWCQPVGWQK